MIDYLLLIIVSFLIFFISYKVIPKRKKTKEFKYKFTGVHVYIIVIVLFFVGLYISTGSGPWDLFVYFGVFVFILGILILDLIIQHYIHKRNK